MLRFIADENFDNRLLLATRKQCRHFDVVRVQDVGLRSCSDPKILEWAAVHARVLLTHDAATLVEFASQRVRTGKRMPGVICVPCNPQIGRIAEDLVLVAECSHEAEMEGRTLFLPLLPPAKARGGG